MSQINYVGVLVGWFAIVVLTSLAIGPYVRFVVDGFHGGYLFGAFAGGGSSMLITGLVIHLHQGAHDGDTT